MKTESVSLMAEMAKSLSQLAIHPQYFITICVRLCVPCAWMDSSTSLFSLGMSVHKVWCEQIKPITGTSPIFLTRARTTWPLTTICTLCEIRSRTIFLILWGSISPLPELICYRWCFHPYFEWNDVIRLCVEHMLRLELSDSGTLGAVTSQDLKAAPLLFVSHDCLKHPLKKPDLWLDFMSREDVWENINCCSRLQPLLAWEPVLIISCPSQL